MYSTVITTTYYFFSLVFPIHHGQRYTCMYKSLTSVHSNLRQLLKVLTRAWVTTVDLQFFHLPDIASCKHGDRINQNWHATCVTPSLHLLFYGVMTCYYCCMLSSHVLLHECFLVSTIFGTPIPTLF